MFKALLSVIAALALVGLCAGGCKTQTLDPSGPYKGDKVLYNVDFTLRTAYDGVHAFVKYEYDHRAELASVPEIKKAADKIRAQAPGLFKEAIAARDIYAASPTPENQSKLDAILEKIHLLLVEANRYTLSQPLEAK